jgi:hypothetical protein
VCSTSSTVWDRSRSHTGDALGLAVRVGIYTYTYHNSVLDGYWIDSAECPLCVQPVRCAVWSVTRSIARVGLANLVMLGVPHSHRPGGLALSCEPAGGRSPPLALPHPAHAALEAQQSLVGPTRRTHVSRPRAIPGSIKNRDSQYMEGPTHNSGNALRAGHILPDSAVSAVLRRILPDSGPDCLLERLSSHAGPD